MAKLRWLTDRLSFWWEAIRSAVWLFVFIGWTVFCFVTQIRDNFLSADRVKKLSTLEVVAKFNWHTWLIGVLVILLLATLEGAYRVHRRRLAATEGTLNDQIGSITSIAEKGRHDHEIAGLKNAHLEKENERLKNEEKSAENYVAYLESRLAPRLELLFEDKTPFVEYVQERGRIGKNGYWKVFRVGVKNTSEDQLRGVTVELEHFETLRRTFESVPLRRMYDVGEVIQREQIYDAPQQAQFSVRPGRTAYVDVVMREMHPAQGTNHKDTILCFTKTFNFVNSIGLMEPLTVTVIASADGAQPERKQFIIYIDDEDQLQMKEADQAASSQNVGSIPSS
jgi:hypothetical protein